MPVLFNATVATMAEGGAPYGLIANGALALRGAAIEWVGPADQLPAQFSGDEHFDCGGRLITPGLIDCHTHIVHGGNRAHEFEMRLGGATYEEIARAGGGILSTVAETRLAKDAVLLADAARRVDALMAEGVTTLEIKSGYGLDAATEMKMLRIARVIGRTRPLSVVTSFLGAHAVPAEYKGRADAYLDEVCIPALEAAHAARFVDAVDGFCEAIAFSPAHIERLFLKAKALGLPVKLHAEQLSNSGGAALAARFAALSADHLEHLDHEGIDAMKAAGTVAVLLPGAAYTLRETTLPPVAKLRQAGVPMAVATDCNPGSSPLSSILTAMNMACTLFRLTPEEALAGATRNAARALGLADRGVIAAGKRADLCLWDASHPAELSYRIGFNPLSERIFGGAL
ncbi:MAG: imidazolonepropionase [Rhizobiaceae bacterium]|nr:imidazolonepropionase [Rhizobiaceae bacterium]